MRPGSTFGADRPDQLWVADITYIPTRSGWLYLAVVLDSPDRAGTAAALLAPVNLLQQ